jgi:hypothetical protein
MKKKLFGLAMIPLVLVMTSCFTLQGFSLLKGAIAPGKSTTARFTVHPHLATKNPPYSTAYQFALVGVSVGEPSGDPALSVGKAKWGANGKFGGPQSMPVSSSLASAIDASGDCNGLGLDFSSVSSLAWKGFMTLNKIADKQKVGTSTTIDVGIKAKSAATSADAVFVLGVTGAWIDDGDGVVNSSDEFDCIGYASTWLNIV